MKKLGFRKSSQILGNLPAEHTSAATSASRLPENNAEGTPQSLNQAINYEAPPTLLAQKDSTVPASE